MRLPGRQRAHTVYSEEGEDSRGRVRRRKSRKKQRRERSASGNRGEGENTVGVKAAKKGPDRGWKGRQRVHRWAAYTSMHLRSSSLTRRTVKEQDHAGQQRDEEEGEVEEKVA